MSWLQDPAKTAENDATEANLRARRALLELPVMTWTRVSLFMATR